MAIKISEIKERLKRKSIDQLKEYCVHNMKLKKADLIDLLEESGCCPNKEATYYDIVYDYKDTIIELLLNCGNNAIKRGDVMRKILFISLLLLSLVSCTLEYETITYEDTIVNKEIRSERDNLATWWWEQPMNKTVYYFTLQEYGEREVTQDEYGKYKIGDMYSWQIKVPKKA